jgi:signal peptidase II
VFKKSTLIAIVAFLCDQLSKWYVYKVIELKELSPVPVIPPILNFTLTWNRGANFGILTSDSPSARWLWIVLALAVSGFLLYGFRNARDRATVFATGLLVGGAIANAFDRLVHGAVLDFLNFQVFWFHNPYSFNLADVFIFAGVLLLILRRGRQA